MDRESTKGNQAFRSSIAPVDVIADSRNDSVCREWFCHPHVEILVGKQIKDMNEEDDSFNSFCNEDNLQNNNDSQYSPSSAYCEVTRTVQRSFPYTDSSDASRVVPFVCYNNPFDPRLYFQGFASMLNIKSAGDILAGPNCEWYQGNVTNDNLFLDTDNINDLVEEHVAQYQAFLRSLSGTPTSAIDGDTTNNNGSELPDANATFPEDLSVMEDIPINWNNFNKDDSAVVQSVMQDKIKAIWGKGDKEICSQPSNKNVQPGPVSRPRPVPWNNNRTMQTAVPNNVFVPNYNTQRFMNRTSNNGSVEISELTNPVGSLHVPVTSCSNKDTVNMSRQVLIRETQAKASSQDFVLRRNVSKGSECNTDITPNLPHSTDHGPMKRSHSTPELAELANVSSSKNNQEDCAGSKALNPLAVDYFPSFHCKSTIGLTSETSKSASVPTNSYSKPCASKLDNGPSISRNKKAVPKPPIGRQRRSHKAAVSQSVTSWMNSSKEMIVSHTQDKNNNFDCQRKNILPKLCTNTSSMSYERTPDLLPPSIFPRSDLGSTNSKQTGNFGCATSDLQNTDVLFPHHPINSGMNSGNNGGGKLRLAGHQHAYAHAMGENKNLLENYFSELAKTQMLANHTFFQIPRSSTDYMHSEPTRTNAPVFLSPVVKVGYPRMDNPYQYQQLPNIPQRNNMNSKEFSYQQQNCGQEMNQAMTFGNVNRSTLPWSSQSSMENDHMAFQSNYPQAPSVCVPSVVTQCQPVYTMSGGVQSGHSGPHQLRGISNITPNTTLPKVSEMPLEVRGKRMDFQQLVHEVKAASNAFSKQKPLAYPPLQWPVPRAQCLANFWRQAFQNDPSQQIMQQGPGIQRPQRFP